MSILLTRRQSFAATLPFIAASAGIAPARKPSSPEAALRAEVVLAARAYDAHFETLRQVGPADAIDSAMTAWNEAARIKHDRLYRAIGALGVDGVWVDGSYHSGPDRVILNLDADPIGGAR